MQYTITITDDVAARIAALVHPYGGTVAGWVRRQAEDMARLTESDQIEVRAMIALKLKRLFLGLVRLNTDPLYFLSRHCSLVFRHEAFFLKGRFATLHRRNPDSAACFASQCDAAASPDTSSLPEHILQRLFFRETQHAVRMLDPRRHRRSGRRRF